MLWVLNAGVQESRPMNTVFEVKGELKIQETPVTAAVCRDGGREGRKEDFCAKKCSIRDACVLYAEKKHEVFLLKNLRTRRWIAKDITYATEYHHIVELLVESLGL